MHETARKVALRQKIWSAAAGKVKDRVTWAQLWVLRLGVTGAVLETLAVSLDKEHQGRALIAALGAFALAAIPVLTKRYLTREETAKWTRARSVSEALKAELFKARTGAAPYDGADAEDKLAEQLAEIEAGAMDLAGETLGVEHSEPSEPEPFTPEEYVEKRLLSQAKDYYLPRASQHKASADRLHTAENVFAIIGAGLSAVAAGQMSGGGEGSLAAWVAVITTIGGAIAAHLSAMRYDRLVTTYTATAGRLDHLAGEFRREGYEAGTPEWSQFVEKCEQSISVENEGWIALWAKKV